MQLGKHKITPCLWFDNEAEDAAKFYCSVFKNSKLGTVSRYGEAGQEVHGKKPGSVMVATFEIDGQPFVALNGGPQFKFSEAISFQVPFDTQDEIDYFWSKLSEGGQEGHCGWLKDKFGLSWQIFPTILPKMMSDPKVEKAQRVTKAFLQMRKFDLATLQRVYAGN